jgi:hypothetical protein
MIPYDELCASLARWREKNGLTNGPSARMPQGPVVAAPPPPAFEPAVTDEMAAGPPTTVGPNPLAALAAPPEPDADDPTGLHQAAPARVASEHTNEIELEGMLVVDDDEL